VRSRCSTRRVAGAGALTAALAFAAVAPGLADTSPPAITVIAPAEGAIFDQHLRIEVSATDADGLGRITLEADGKPIRSFTDHLVSGTAVGLDWKRARELGLGDHKITVIAVDRLGSNPVTGRENQASVDVGVRRVDATTLPKQPTRIGIRLSGSGLRRTVSGRVTAPGADTMSASFPLAGKVRVTWQIFSNGRFKTRHKDSDAKIAPYAFTQRLAGRGRWRVRVDYEPVAPYRASASKTITFRVG
jgi:hypothetical protein